MLNQSFRQVFVANTPVLLASGQTVENLASGQVAIVDGKSYQSTTTPTYATNKALYVVHGTPDLSSLPAGFGAPNQNEYSKLIKGKLLKNFRGKAARRGQLEAGVLGFSGDPTDTNTLFARPGQKKTVFVTLYGGFIDKLYTKQGLTKQFSVRTDFVDPCTDADPCVAVDCNLLVHDLVSQINNDKDLKKFIKTSAIVSCDPALDAPTTTTAYVFEVTVADTQDAQALTNVQVQYPEDKVERIATSGSTSTYRVIRAANTLPDDLSTGTTLVIPECDVCPDGYTLRDAGFAYKVVRNDDGDATAATTVGTDYAIAGDESVARASYEFGQSTYVVVSDVELTPEVGDQVEFLGEIRHSCVLDTPTTVDWAANGTLVRFPKTYRLTLADDKCGDDRLTDIQAAYPDNVVTLVTGSIGDCVHTYEITVLSQPVDAASCTPDQLKFVQPQSFEGSQWIETPAAALPDGTTCLCGIRFDVIATNRTVTESTYDAFPSNDIDTVHIHVSEFNPDYNTVDDVPWVYRKIQGYIPEIGRGEYIRELEKDSLMYALRHRSTDPVVREFEKFEFNAKAGKFYDEYVLEFEFEYKVGGWSNKYVDSYHLHVFFPEGEGKAFETAVNGYVSSANIALDPVIL